MDGCRLLGTALESTGSCNSPTRKGLRTDVCTRFALGDSRPACCSSRWDRPFFGKPSPRRSRLPRQAMPAQNLLDALDTAGQFGGLPGGEHLTLTGGFQIISGGREGTLSLTAESEFGWHVYSITQKDGGPQRSRIDVESGGAIPGERAVSARPVARRQELRVLQSPGRRARRSRDLDGADPPGGDGRTRGACHSPPVQRSGVRRRGSLHSDYGPRDRGPLCGLLPALADEHRAGRHSG